MVKWQSSICKDNLIAYMSVVILEGAPFITRMSIHECTKGALI